MATELVPFSDLLSTVVDNRGRTCPTSESGIPLIATNCIRNDLLYPSYDKVRYVSHQIYKSWFRGHPEPGDLIFVLKGTPGRVCIAPDPVDFCIAQDMVALRADRSKIYPKYLFALLRSPQIQTKIEQMHVGTLIPHFKKGDFERLLLPVPKPEVQEFIGNAYFNLSARIDLNRRMNETLEGMARLVFKSWFVDFEPVRSKAEGRDTGLPKRLADLFPDSFEESTIGKIPKGWRVGRLDDLLVLQRGFDLPTPARTPGPYPVIAASGPSGTHDRFMVRGPGVTTGRSGVLGNVYYVHEDFWPLNTSLWVKEFKNSSPAYAFYLLRRLDFHIYNAGSAVPTLNRNHVHGLLTLLPPGDLIQRFETFAVAMLSRQRANEAESATLASLRHTLLPKLISGEIRLLTAKLVEEAALQ